jgi:signal peptidase II
LHLPRYRGPEPVEGLPVFVSEAVNEKEWLRQAQPHGIEEATVNTTSPRILAFSIAVAIFIADQLFKWFVTGPMELKIEGDEFYILPFFQFTLTFNYGVALSLFEAGTDTARWVLTGVLAAITTGVGFWLWREKERIDAIGLAMILGGALGNLLDRARFGYVVDFLDLHFGSFRPFLVFNLADAAITIGVLVLLARSFLDGKAKPANGE